MVSYIVSVHVCARVSVHVCALCVRVCKCVFMCVCARMRALCGWVAGTLVQLPLSGFVFYRTRARLTQQLVLRASLC